MAGLLASVDAVFAPVFEALQPRASSGLRVSQHADLQVDGVLGLARALGRVPRELAEEVLTMARERGLDSICDRAVVAPPGFINLTLSSDFLGNELKKMAGEPASLGVTERAAGTHSSSRLRGAQCSQANARRSSAVDNYRRLAREVARPGRP